MMNAQRILRAVDRSLNDRIQAVQHTEDLGMTGGLKEARTIVHGMLHAVQEFPEVFMGEITLEIHSDEAPARELTSIDRLSDMVRIIEYGKEKGFTKQEIDAAIWTTAKLSWTVPAEQLTELIAAAWTQWEQAAEALFR